MGENNKIPLIADLNRAFYNLVKTIITDIPELRVMGFESSRTTDQLPPVGIDVNLSDIQVDRNRPTPQIGHRIFIPVDPKDYIIDDELVEDVPSKYNTSQPLPVLLTYQVHSWCHSATKQLSLDQAILKLLPERGVLNFEIDSIEYELPIMLLGIENLDDLRENFRERLYRFSVEAWIQGTAADSESKIITSSEIKVYEMKEPENFEIELMKIEASEI